uniref:Endoplasmic reticulum transmembrane protein n=1 Tax=Syphacia muris TaxID=451379 RepID=A0A0N5AKR5_9BILA
MCNGMTSRAVFWSRLIFCVFSVTVFFLFTSQYQNYRHNYSELLQKYSELLAYSDGISAQLQLVPLMNLVQLTQVWFILECKRKVRAAELSNSAYSVNFKAYNAENERLNSAFHNISRALQSLSGYPSSNINDNIESLRKVISDLEKKKTDAENRSQDSERLLLEAKKKLENCSHFISSNVSDTAKQKKV